MVQTRGFQLRERVSDRTLDPRLFVTGPSALGSILSGGIKGLDTGLRAERQRKLQEEQLGLRKMSEERLQEGQEAELEDRERALESEETFRKSLLRDIESLNALQEAQSLNEELSGALEQEGVSPEDAIESVNRVKGELSRLGKLSENLEGFTPPDKPRLATIQSFLSGDTDIESLRKQEREARMDAPTPQEQEKEQLQLKKLRKEVKEEPDNRQKFESLEDLQMEYDEFNVRGEQLDSGEWVATGFNMRDDSEADSFIPFDVPKRERGLINSMIRSVGFPEEGETREEFIERYNKYIEEVKSDPLSSVISALFSGRTLGINPQPSEAVDTEPEESELLSLDEARKRAMERLQGSSR